jgi:hypothetical protein
MPNKIPSPMDSLQIFGTKPYTAQNKGHIFRDQSSSSRVEKIKLAALTANKRSQPTNGIVIKKDDKNSRLDALSRVRGGGYMVPPKVRHTNDEVSKTIVTGK